MNPIVYEEDVDDVEFPTIKFSNDLVYEPINNKNNSFCNRTKNIFKNKTYFFIFICAIIILIALIIIIAVFVSRKDSKDNNNVIDDWNGGTIIIQINKDPKNNNVDIITNDKINLSEGDYKIEQINSLRRLKWITFSNNNNENNLKLKIKFIKPLKSMEQMFKDNNNIKAIDLSNLNFDQIDNMNSAFLNCRSLEQINLLNINPKILTSMDNTFENCISLTELNLNSFTKNNLKSMANSFKNCLNLKKLFMENLNLNGINISGAFDFLDKNILLYINKQSFDIINNGTNFNCSENICKKSENNSTDPTTQDSTEEIFKIDDSTIETQTTTIEYSKEGGGPATEEPIKDPNEEMLFP